MNAYRIISAERASFPVSVMCEVLGVSRSGFDEWERRASSERELSDAWLTSRLGRLGRRRAYKAVVPHSAGGPPRPGYRRRPGVYDEPALIPVIPEWACH